MDLCCRKCCFLETRKFRRQQIVFSDNWFHGLLFSSMEIIPHTLTTCQLLHVCLFFGGRIIPGQFVSKKMYWCPVNEQQLTWIHCDVSQSGWFHQLCTDRRAGSTNMSTSTEARHDCVTSMQEGLKKENIVRENVIEFNKWHKLFLFEGNRKSLLHSLRLNFFSFVGKTWHFISSTIKGGCENATCDILSGKITRESSQLKSFNPLKEEGKINNHPNVKVNGRLAWMRLLEK